MSAEERAAEVLAERLTSPDMAEVVARAICDEQTHGRVEYKRRVGYQGRLSLARASLDAVCRALGLPDSVDALLADRANAERARAAVEGCAPGCTLADGHYAPSQCVAEDVWMTPERLANRAALTAADPEAQP